MRRLRLISNVTNSKHVFFHFVVYLFVKIFLVFNCLAVVVVVVVIMSIAVYCC